MLGNYARLQTRSGKAKVIKQWKADWWLKMTTDLFQWNIIMQMPWEVLSKLSTCMFRVRMQMAFRKLLLFPRQMSQVPSITTSFSGALHLLLPLADRINKKGLIQYKSMKNQCIL